MVLNELADARLSAWESYYVIVGSSAGALIGLQFVVVTLLADLRKRASANAESMRAFGTPTVVHLSGTLFISAVMSAPWPALDLAARVVALGALAGLVYAGIVIRRARRQTAYRPMGDDWFWYVLLPCLLYAALAIAAFRLPSATGPALFAIAAVALALLAVGIHNAWDTVTHVVFTVRRDDDAESAETEAKSSGGST